MKSFSIFAATAFLATALVEGHSTVHEISVNGKSQGNGVNKYTRSPKNPPGLSYNNGPVKDLKSADMKCNNNNVEVPTWVEVQAGDKIGFKWSRDGGAEVLDPSHHGPVMTYIGSASGSNWNKIAQSGYLGNNQWATDAMIANAGVAYATIPELAPGKYLLRHEFIGLHEADALYTQNAARGAQFYPSCTQITIKGSSTKTLPAGVSFPGAYTDSTPGVQFNLYGGDPATYKIPGPAVWNGASGGSAPPAQDAPVTTSAKPTASTTRMVTSVKPTSTTKASVKPTTTTKASTPAPTNNAGTAAKWAQCGGKGFSGPTKCVSGTKCTFSNEYYSQCL